MKENVRQIIIRQPSALYFVGFIGAAIYFIQHASGFWLGVLGFLKACVWPAFAVYYLLESLKV